MSSIHTMPRGVPSRNGVRRESIIPDTQPPAALLGGAHVDLLAPGTVTFILYAPWKPYVSVVGDFNHWNTRAHAMHDDGSGRWWVTLPHPGATRYGFYVAVDADSHVWVGDPYARAVVWEDDGVWAQLPAAGAQSFAWSDDDWSTPALRDMVIYELCVRDFVGVWKANEQVRGTFAELRKRVGYLAALGVNAVELMPVQAFPGDSSWGYNPVFYFAPATVYGPADELRHFVDECHAAGIAVLLDVAFNHAWGQHPWYRIYPPMYNPKGEFLSDLNPMFHHTPTNVNGWGGVDWDHFVPATTRYFQDVVRYWLREFHIDGFRFDWVCGVDYDSGNPMQPHFRADAGIAPIVAAAKQEKPDCVLIGEFWTLDGTHPDKTAARMVRETAMDAAWNGVFHHTLEDILNQRWQWERKDIKRAMGGFRDLGYSAASEVINFTASHDEVRPEHEIRFYSAKNMACPVGWSVERLALAVARLGLVALFGSAGVPMIYSGQEFGDNDARTIDFLPLQWYRLEDAAHHAHAEVVKRLIAARHAHPALRSDFVAFDDTDFAAEKLLRLRRWDSSGTDAGTIVLNVSPAARTIEVHLPFAGEWVDVVSELRYQVAGGGGRANGSGDQGASLELMLEPYGAALLVPA